MRILGERVNNLALVVLILTYGFLAWLPSKLPISDSDKLLLFLLVVFCGLPVGAWLIVVFKDFGEPKQ